MPIFSIFSSGSEFSIIQNILLIQKLQVGDRSSLSSLLRSFLIGPLESDSEK